jgi:hypothetical protein
VKRIDLSRSKRDIMGRGSSQLDMATQSKRNILTSRGNDGYPHITENSERQGMTENSEFGNQNPRFARRGSQLEDILANPSSKFGHKHTKSHADKVTLFREGLKTVMDSNFSDARIKFKNTGAKSHYSLKKKLGAGGMSMATDQ